MERLTESLDARDYGGKAAGLANLLSLGLDVPSGFVIAPGEPLDETRLWNAVSKWTAAADGSGMARLAVRSSAEDEDSAHASHAGEFMSVLDDFTCRDLIEAIIAVRTSGSGSEDIAVIVQTTVEAEFSGVAFSCDPLEYYRGQSVVSWTKGLGQGLVSGSESGTTFAVTTDDPRSELWPGEAETLIGLVSGLRRIEDSLGEPVDAEWAIDSAGRLWMLQARPVVLPRPRIVDAASLDELSSLSSVVAGHSKMRLRRAAAHLGVEMSKAVVVTTSGSRSQPALPVGLPSEDAAGLSIVLLQPNRVENKVQREFAQVDSTDVPLFTLGCRRYSIRRYPAPDAASEVLSDVLARGLDVAWTATAVVQEIYDAEATGIIRRLHDEYVVEIAHGHFVPKGVVDPTRLIVSESGEVLELHRAIQDVVYHFINGHVVTEQPAERQVDLTEADIVDAVMQVVPLFADYPDAALEFGIRKSRGRVRAYVIDVAEADRSSTAALLTRELIASGVVSPGQGAGDAVRVLNVDQADLDSHLLSQFEAGAEGALHDVVVVADHASVDLLPLVNRAGPGSAFVFRQASLLSHLCVVLRERGVPAVVIDDDELFESIEEGCRIEVDTLKPAVRGHDRILVSAR